MSKIKSIWTADNIAHLTKLLVNSEGQSQATFVSGAKNALKYKVMGDKGREKTEYYTEKQIIAKAREIARKAKSAGYDISVPRKVANTSIVSNWDEVFKAAGAVKTKAGKK